MAAPMPYLEKTAINPVAPITIARSASFSVYDLNDTTFTTPLNVTRLSDGVTTTTLLSDSNGYLPDFTVIDRNSVVLRTTDGQFKKTIVTSSPVQGPKGDTGAPGTPGAKGDPGDVSTWQPNTYYPTQKPLVNPSGDLVVVTTAHTSGASYDASKFAYSGTFLASTDAASTYLKQSDATATYARFVNVARNPDLIITGAITRDANGAATSAPVTWPDGTAGTYTADTVSAAYPGAVDGYHITYGSPATKTYTQPTITRDSNGAATNVPQIVVS